jgi:L-aspartate oxidase
LASNSLLEGLVFGARIAENIAASIPEFSEPKLSNSVEILLDPVIRTALQQAMSRGAGVVRSKETLDETLMTLQKLALFTTNEANIDSWETTNLYYLATAIVRSALERSESRGSHWRADFPNVSQAWGKRIHQRIDSNGTWSSETAELGVTDVFSATK